MHCKDTILRTQNNWPYSKLIPNSGNDYELKKYIAWYNTKRVKLRLKGMSPAQYRAQYYRELNNQI